MADLARQVPLRQTRLSAVLSVGHRDRTVEGPVSRVCRHSDLQRRPAASASAQWDHNVHPLQLSSHCAISFLLDSSATAEKAVGVTRLVWPASGWSIQGLQIVDLSAGRVRVHPTPRNPPRFRRSGCQSAGRSRAPHAPSPGAGDGPGSPGRSCALGVKRDEQVLTAAGARHHEQSRAQIPRRCSSSRMVMSSGAENAGGMATHDGRGGCNTSPCLKRFAMDSGSRRRGCARSAGPAICALHPKQFKAAQSGWR